MNTRHSLIQITLAALLVICSVETVKSQSFDWAAGASGIYAGYDYASINSGEDLIVASKETTPSYGITADKAIYDGEGNELPVYMRGEVTGILISYDDKGAFNWKRSFPLYPYTELLGMVTKGQTTVLLVKMNTDVYEPTFRWYKKFEPSYYLVYFNRWGIIYAYTKIFDKAPEIRITQFKKQGSGYVLYGYDQGLNTFKDLGANSESRNNRFLLKLNFFGKPRWAKFIDVSGSVSGLLATSDDGNIYLAGSYQNSISFTKDVEFVAPPLGKGEKPFHAYIACYSKKGTFQWAKDVGRQSQITNTVANETGLYGSLVLKGGNEAFGLEIDTTNRKYVSHFHVNSQGKLEWFSSIAAGETHSLQLDDEGNFYTVGPSYRPYFANGTIGDIPLMEKTRSYIAKYNAKGELQDIWQTRLMLSNEVDNPTNLLIGDHDELYLAGAVFYGGVVQMNSVDTAFKKGMAYGRSPFIAKIKK